MARLYVTTPIYYVNDLPHIGHIYTTVVADTVARYRRLAGDEVHFVTGTDEHGQKIERAAQAQGIHPQALADRVVARYHQLWRQFAISHDDFIRTTEERHRAGVEEIVRRIERAGDLYVDRHEGWYCTACETFYTDKELLSGNVCPTHGTPAEWKAEENVFFRLSAFQDRLVAWYREPEAVRPEVRRNEVRSFVEAGLRDLSVSRASLAWGIPFPGHSGQTTYVWLDALTNYLSALGFGRRDSSLYERFWAGDGTRLHLVGKDILRHHAVFWPAFLMSAGLPLPTTVFAHGFWLRDAKKISKSGGSVARPDDLVERFGADSLRYFLLREMVFGQDASFSDEAFVDRYNSDLANDLGNTVSRVVTLSRRAFAGATPPEPCEDNPIIAAAEAAVRDYRQAMDELAFQRGLEALWRLLAEANQYLVAKEPWKLIKAEGATPRVSRVLWNGLEAARIVASGLLPVMPRKAVEILAAVGVEEPPPGLAALAWGGTPTGRALPEPAPLFPRIDKEAYLAAPAAPAGPAAGETDPAAGKAPAPEGVAAPGATTRGRKEAKAMITIEDFLGTDLRVGTVKEAAAIPRSDKLLRLAVDLGEGSPRTLVAGIARQYRPEELVGRQVVVVANLKPATLLGVESRGMVLAASRDGEAVLLHPERPVPDGTPVR